MAKTAAAATVVLEEAKLKFDKSLEIWYNKIYKIKGKVCFVNGVAKEA